VSGLQKLVERAGIAAKMPFKVHPRYSRLKANASLLGNEIAKTARE
jgi:hypothetical protein